jgi:hypothetical protein
MRLFPAGLPKVHTGVWSKYRRREVSPHRGVHPKGLYDIHEPARAELRRAPDQCHAREFRHGGTESIASSFVSPLDEA